MKIILILFFTFIFIDGFAQQSDSLAYEMQRNKINGMLDLRSQKFGQYDVSLTQRTGIFGLKTKKDMQRSINILTEIITTDNQILKETKTLLDFKTFQQEQVQTKSVESESRGLAYMRTINKLQTENDRIQAEFKELKKDKKLYQLISYGLALALIGTALFVYRKISSK